jgi:hypothetical protein
LYRTWRGRAAIGAAVLFAVVLISMEASGCAAAAPTAEGDKNVADKNVAAEIGGQKITLQELDDYLRKNNNTAFQAFYDARRAALEGLIADRLIEAEAKAKGTTAEKLRADVTSSVPAVTDADVQAFYDQNKARMGGQTLDQMKDRIKPFLASQKQQQAMTDFINGLKAKSAVKITLQPPRADVRVTETDPAKGRKDAPIQIVEFSDFQ